MNNPPKLEDDEREMLAEWRGLKKIKLVGSPDGYELPLDIAKELGVDVMFCDRWLNDLSSPETYHQVSLLLDKLRSMYFVHIIAFGTGFSVSVEVNGDYVAAEGENLNEVIIRAILEVIDEH